MATRKSKSRRTSPPRRPTGARASRRIADLLREKRIEKNLSQNDLARMMGYESAQFVSDWERAYSAVPLPKIIDLAKILDFDHARVFEMFVEFSKERVERELRAEYRFLLDRKA